MNDDLTDDRVLAAYQRARDDLLAERNDRGHWTGQLSTSALATATAVMALETVRRQAPPLTTYDSPLTSLIDGGLKWLATHQNDDGGWGDTSKSFSNISTTMLCHAVLQATRQRWSEDSTPAPLSSRGAYEAVIERAKRYIAKVGGVPAVVARYGKDKTFSVPILTHCALAGLVDWRDVQQLPFELACVPARFYKTVRLPVVSYALPALIAIGQVRHHFQPTRIPGLRWLRNRARRKSLDVLERIQPSGGGFLEAAPLTSFVTMSLAGMGLVEHPVVNKGVEFLVNSVRDDGSWPIDTNLATWVTTLSVNALGPDLPDDAREPILRWLLDQQYKEVHPFTNANPGGWSWTDLAGGVPDADDTPGAILAILELVKESSVQSPGSGVSREARPGDTDELPCATAVSAVPASGSVSKFRTADTAVAHLPDELVAEAHDAVRRGVRWLLDLQNRDGGWPTFCRGWGKLPFDRSSPDISAHVLRAMQEYADAILRKLQRQVKLSQDELLAELAGVSFKTRLAESWTSGRARLTQSLWGIQFLNKRQNDDGYWLPLWFGNQHAVDERNAVYGTTRVLSTYRTTSEPNVEQYLERAVSWLRSAQNPDGGWGGDVGCPSSVEETALAVEVLLSDPSESSQLAARRGLLWLIERVENGTYREPTPIGFYFAKLWYFERLYPLIFTVAALRRACEVLADDKSS